MLKHKHDGRVDIVEATWVLRRVLKLFGQRWPLPWLPESPRGFCSDGSAENLRRTSLFISRLKSLAGWRFRAVQAKIWRRWTLKKQKYRYTWTAILGLKRRFLILWKSISPKKLLLNSKVSLATSSVFFGSHSKLGRATFLRTFRALKATLCSTNL